MATRTGTGMVLSVSVVLGFYGYRLLRDKIVLRFDASVSSLEGSGEVWLPHCVDSVQLVVMVLKPQQVFCILVGEQAGFSQQCLVLEISTRQLLIDRLQTQEEHPMTKPGPMSENMSCSSS